MIDVIVEKLRESSDKNGNKDSRKNLGHTCFC